MSSYLNIVILTGELSYVKIKYRLSKLSEERTYVVMKIKQPEYKYENEKVVESGWIYHTVTLFKTTKMPINKLKVGQHVTIRGKLAPYDDEMGNPRYNIQVEEIFFNYNAEE